MKPTITKIVCPKCASPKTELAKWVTYTDVNTQDTEHGREHRCKACGHIWQIMDVIKPDPRQAHTADPRETKPL